MAETGAVQSAVEGAVAPASGPSPAPRTPTSKKWVTAVADRVSTKWIGGIATALILGATAAFGGLGTVPEPPLPELSAGETFTGAGLEMTPQRAVLIDELSDTGVTPAEGERLLVLLVDVTNIDDTARPATATGSVAEIRVDDAPDVAGAIARYDDTTLNPWLQPGVPAPLVLTWAVPADAYAGGDELRVALHTATEYSGEFFIHGDYWEDVEVGAYATLSIEDVGAGVTE
ncbi:hypothetical protein [Microbacterium sp. CIAB417]|uniref:hypothetical protein n=1 Tax=Microbacterium sp. CIAB417 TaxID=2860287 RepID=UPI001FACDCFA|nr:hypothetical protein [Microbacterium sp. CIAB417]